MHVLIWLHIVASLALAVYSLHEGMLLIVRAIKRRAHHPAAQVEGIPEPRVTIQLPLYNERAVAGRLIKACAALDWPRDRLQIQVLDDSTDDTRLAAASAVELACAGGVDAQLSLRESRAGYKAGALAAAFARASGEFIAVFDADFVPPRDFLRRVMPEFQTPDADRLGFVQTRWDYLNRDDDAVTRAQALMLDMHFMIEQPARSATGMCMSFNGSGGVWRKTAIADAGGWSADTLTEDLDLCYRAQLRGWRGRYRADIGAPGELPVSALSLKRQQARWARGSAQCTRKLGPAVLRSNLRPLFKASALIHLSGYLLHTLLLIITLTTPLTALMAEGDLPRWLGVIGLAGTWPLLAMLAGGALRRRPLRRLAMDVPAAALFGIGLSLSNTISWFTGLLTRASGEFARTPKRGDGAGALYGIEGTDRLVLAELGLGLFSLGAAILLLRDGQPIAAASSFLYAYGHAGFGLLQVVQTAQRARKMRLARAAA